MEALKACTNQTDIAVEIIRLNNELDLYVSWKMYAMALEVSFEVAVRSMRDCVFFLSRILL